MDLVDIPISNLVTFDQNPREISARKLSQLKESIRTFGLFKPILVWKDENGKMIVIGGNQRLRAITEMVSSKEIEMEVIPTINWGGDRASAYTIALRDNNADGDWAWDSLSSYIADLEGLTKESGLSMSLTGFDDTLLQDLRDLSTAVDSNLDRFTSDLDDESEPEIEESAEDEDSATPEPASGEAEDVEHDPKTGRQIARFTVGSIRGQIGVEQYRRFLHVWQVHADSTDSTDIKTILDSLLRNLEATETNDIRAAALISIENEIKTHLNKLAVTEADHAAMDAVSDVFDGLRTEWNK